MQVKSSPIIVHGHLLYVLPDSFNQRLGLSCMKLTQKFSPVVTGFAMNLGTVQKSKAHGHQEGDRKEEESQCIGN